MKAMSVGDFKAQFSDVLRWVASGEEVAIEYGRKKQVVAFLIPAKNARRKGKRPIGLLEGKASFRMTKGFKMTAEEILGE